MVIFGLIFGVSAVAEAQNWTKSWAKWSESPRFSLSLSGGLSFFETLNSSRYSDHWFEDQLASVNESADIVFSRTTGFYGGFSLEYLLNSEFSLQFLLGYRKAPLETTSKTSLSWGWKDGRFDSRSTTWTGGGSALSTVPVVLSVVYRIRMGDLFFIRVLIGGGLFYNKLSDTFSMIGFGFTRWEQIAERQYMQYIDAIGVSSKIVKTGWTSLGGRCGVGIDVPLGNSLGLKLDIEYFFSSSQKMAWTLIPGTSDGLYFSSAFPILKVVEFTSENAINYGWTISKMDISPSFIQASIGFRLNLGP